METPILNPNKSSFSKLGGSQPSREFKGPRQMWTATRGFPFESFQHQDEQCLWFLLHGLAAVLQGEAEYHNVSLVGSYLIFIAVKTSDFSFPA